MTNPNTWGPDQTLALEDGRALGYRTHGHADGIPLIFLHGAPGSRYVLSEHDPLARLSDLYLVTPERPGYGLSFHHHVSSPPY